MDAFVNRLRKVNRHIAKWAKRQQITCYRIYDLDIPEFPFCIDRYHDYLHIAEYASPLRRNDEDHSLWLDECIKAVMQALEVPLENIYLKERRRLDRRNEQYEKVNLKQELITVEEQGLKFYVNLSDYLDTGLFLDHRPLRQVFRNESANKHVLNLFAYTGAFSVYAAAGSAASVTTVDLSNTYLQWAENNMILNGLYQPLNHKFVQSDAMLFLKSTADNAFDLVFVDPPVFSNSKKMKGTWDTQRDHAALLHILLQKVKPGGVVYFSNNLRSFQPQFERLNYSSLKDISSQTIPEDFRNKLIHRCYKIQK